MLISHGNFNFLKLRDSQVQFNMIRGPISCHSQQGRITHTRCQYEQTQALHRPGSFALSSKSAYVLLSFCPPRHSPTPFPAFLLTTVSSLSMTWSDLQPYILCKPFSWNPSSFSQLYSLEVPYLRKTFFLVLSGSWTNTPPWIYHCSFNSACLKQIPSSLPVLLHTSGIPYLPGWHHQPHKELWVTKAGQNWWPFKAAFVK